MIALGIDPGLSGALALIRLDMTGAPAVVSVLDMPTFGADAKRRVAPAEIVRWIARMPPAEAAYVERAQAMPDQGSSSGFLYGRAVGAVEATVLCCGIPLFTAEPAVWKRRFGLLKQDKKASTAMALLVLKGAGAHLTLVKHHNRAESMLIGLWGAERRIGGKGLFAA